MLVEGLIIVIDLDKFSEFIDKQGLDSYKPNTITGTLTELVSRFVYKWHGVVIYGLDSERGTEEAVIEIPYGYEYIDEIIKDLEEIRDEINKLGASVSIAIVIDIVCPELSGSRRLAYRGTIGRKRAWRLIRKIKKNGGNKVVFA